MTTTDLVDASYAQLCALRDALYERYPHLRDRVPKRTTRDRVKAAERFLGAAEEEDADRCYDSLMRLMEFT